MSLKMQSVARGERPQFSEHPDVDRALATVMALAQEVAVLREQLATVIALAAARGVLTVEEVAAFEPPLADAAARDAWRQAFIERVLYAFRADLPAGTPSASSPPR